MRILIVDNVRSLHNIGSFFRTSDCLGIEAIYLCGCSALPPRKEISKTALGAEELVVWKYFDTTLAAMAAARDAGCLIYALEITPEAQAISSYAAATDWALIVGNEILGISDEVIVASDQVLCIPMQGAKQSLNVSVAAGIALYQLSCKTAK